LADRHLGSGAPQLRGWASVVAPACPEKSSCWSKGRASSAVPMVARLWSASSYYDPHRRGSVTRHAGQRAWRGMNNRSLVATPAGIGAGCPHGGQRGDRASTCYSPSFGQVCAASSVAPSLCMRLIAPMIISQTLGEPSWRLDCWRRC
jgi:hypothetical protein